MKNQFKKSPDTGQFEQFLDTEYKVRFVSCDTGDSGLGLVWLRFDSSTDCRVALGQMGIG